MQAIPTSESRQQVSLGQLFSYPFRIFFVSMAALGALVIPLWTLQITGMINLPLAIPGVYWHQHEMLFGFLSAAIAGFLLTAVCVWTKTERLHGSPLIILWVVWLAGRLLLAFGAGAPDWMVHTVNLAFLPLVMLDAGHRIWRARQARQLVILLVLGMLWLMQIGFVTQLEPRFSYGALIMALALISVVAGRITPAFTMGWLRQQGLNASAVRMIPKLDLITLASLILLMISLVIGIHALTALLAITAAVLMSTRLVLWQGWLARTEPLLWILHLSLLWVPASLVLLAGSLLAGWPVSAWTHAAGTGAVGCLVLGVIARVSLGHTGRPLVLPKGMVLAFVAIHMAALVRVLTAFTLIPWQTGIAGSALLWLLAYGIFLLRYTKILASPRQDGLPG